MIKGIWRKFSVLRARMQAHAGHPWSPIPHIYFVQKPWLISRWHTNMGKVSGKNYHTMERWFVVRWISISDFFGRYVLQTKDRKEQPVRQSCSVMVWACGCAQSQKFKSLHLTLRSSSLWFEVVVLPNKCLTLPWVEIFYTEHMLVFKHTALISNCPLSRHPLPSVNVAICSMRSAFTIPTQMACLWAGLKIWRTLEWSDWPWTLWCCCHQWP